MRSSLAATTPARADRRDWTAQQPAIVNAACNRLAAKAHCWYVITIASAINRQGWTPMNVVLRLSAVAVVCLSGAIACAPAQPNLANPTVKGDRSTIQGDAAATRLQQTTTE